MTVSVKHSSKFRFVVAATAMLTSMGVLVVTGSGVAVAKKLPHAVGIANCPIYSGSGTVNPGLTPAGSPGGVKIDFTASLTNPTGGPCGNSSVTSPAGVTIDGGTVTGSGFYQPLASGASSCANFDGVDVVGKIKVTIAWLTTPPGAIANTTIVYRNNPATVSGAPVDTITLKAPPGTAIETGSFSSPSAGNTTALKTDLPGPACGAGPYSTFNILGGNVLV